MNKLQASFCLSFFIIAGNAGTSRAQHTQAEDANTSNALTQMSSALSTPANQRPDEKPLSDKLNSHLPEWLSVSGEIRLRTADVAGDFFRDSNDSYLLSRLHLNMQIKPNKWLKFYFQAQDSHIIGASRTASLPPLQIDTMDLRLGYIEIGDAETGHLRIRVGRQELAFGEERLLGPANWLNTPRSFDGALGTFRDNGIRLDLFMASVAKIHDGQFNENTPGNNIYGLYTDFSKLIPQAKIEPYLFWRRQSGLATENNVPGISNFGTVGLRWAGKLPAGDDYDFELAKQNGSLGGDSIDARAGHWLFGHTFANLGWSPRVFGEYNYASGDRKIGDGKRNTFDQLFPSGHDLYGLTDQVGWKNIRHVRSGMEAKPKANWTLSTRYSLYWLADSHDALYSAASTAIAESLTGAAGDYVGQELDFVSSLSIHKWTLFSLGFGHLFPGTFLEKTTQHQGYNYPFAAMTYTF